MMMMKSKKLFGILVLIVISCGIPLSLFGQTVEGVLPDGREYFLMKLKCPYPDSDYMMAWDIWDNYCMLIEGDLRSVVESDSQIKYLGDINEKNYKIVCELIEENYIPEMYNCYILSIQDPEIGNEELIILVMIEDIDGDNTLHLRSCSWLAIEGA